MIAPPLQIGNAGRQAAAAIMEMEIEDSKSINVAKKVKQNEVIGIFRMRNFFWEFCKIFFCVFLEVLIAEFWLLI